MIFGIFIHPWLDTFDLPDHSEGDQIYANYS